MPKTSEMRESNFLRKEDVGQGMLLTITGCMKKNVAQDGAAPDHKWCLTFEESDKPLVLNATNIQLCEQICESDDTDDWIGQHIVAFTDPTISYGGKVVGGIRVRKPKVNTKKPKPIHVPEPDEEDDSVPF